MGRFFQTTTLRAAWVLLLAVFYFLNSRGTARASIIYVRATGDRIATNGQSWATAYLKVQPAIDATVPGDQVWVAAGIYRENVVLKEGVALFGGFSGIEVERGQRNWNLHESILDGGGAGRVVTLAGQGTTATRLDGFVLRNGSADFGAGIYTTIPNFIAANNLIISNTAVGVFGGGGVFFDEVPSADTLSGLDTFTNLADRLLGPKLRDGIELFPTNHYTAHVHQQLQVAANITDAAKNGGAAYPLVFRPIFTNANGRILICGYTEAQDASFLSNAWIDLSKSADRLLIMDDTMRSNANVYGQPIVLSAKKHLPNFNEFSMETVVDLVRKLELRKPNTNPLTRPSETNEMYLLAITNVFGVEAWNSYAQSFVEPIQLSVQHTVSIGLGGTTNYPTLLQKQWTNSSEMVITNWNGLSSSRRELSFIKLYATGVATLPNSILLGRPPFLQSVTNKFQKSVGFQTPELVLNITNRVSYSAVVQGRVIDFVNLDRLVTKMDLTRTIFSGDTITYPGALWSTNLVSGAGSPPTGIQRQIEVALGETESNDNRFWNDFGAGMINDISLQSMIDQFRYFMGFTPLYGPITTFPTNVMQVPFSPMQQLYFRSAWQANDPLVHYHAEDLKSPDDLVRVIPPRKTVMEFSQSNIGRLNERFRPFYDPRVWTNNPFGFSASRHHEPNPALQDPGVRWSQDWNFPVDGSLHLDALNRIHRGTPWQTLYSRNEGISQHVWLDWSGSNETQPTNDWALMRTLLRQRSEDSANGATLVNNTVVGNTSAIGIAGHNSLINNIIAGNGSGLERLAAVPVELHRNCLFGNSVFDYAGIAAGPTDITQDPQFVSTRNLRLRATSACVDAADADLLVNGLLLNESARKQGKGLDVGAYELGPNDAPVLGLLSVSGAGTGATIRVTGFDGQYAVQRSEDLIHWETLFTNITANGSFDSSDSTAATNSFYRAVRIP